MCYNKRCAVLLGHRIHYGNVDRFWVVVCTSHGVACRMSLQSGRSQREKTKRQQLNLYVVSCSSMHIRTTCRRQPDGLRRWSGFNILPACYERRSPRHYLRNTVTLTEHTLCACRIPRSEYQSAASRCCLWENATRKSSCNWRGLVNDLGYHTKVCLQYISLASGWLSYSAQALVILLR